MRGHSYHVRTLCETREFGLEATIVPSDAAAVLPRLLASSHMVFSAHQRRIYKHANDNACQNVKLYAASTVELLPNRILSFLIRHHGIGTCTGT